MMVNPFKEIKGSRSPNYGRGSRYCNRCETAYLGSNILSYMRITAKNKV